METFGDKIQELRQSRKLPLRLVAESLGIAPSLLSEIESGRSKASRQLVVKLAGYFAADENELLITWLSDKLPYKVDDKNLVIKPLEVAEKPVNYISGMREDPGSIINLIRTVLADDGRVTTAWLFGSYARGEGKVNSDVDIMVELNKLKTYSMFDLLDLSFLLEKKINKKVDLVEKGCLKPFALETANNDLIKVYG